MKAPITYVTDVPYVAAFTPELSPDWLDLVATIAAFEPPRRRQAFAWCELGCGLGTAATIHAAANPEAVFVGIDAMPDHIAAAQRLSAAAGTANLTFHALDFESAAELDLPPFQYIVAHGVYSWIDAAAMVSFRRFIERHLAPGGLVYISYNTMPGWAPDAPFQHLVRALAEDQPGDSNRRFAAAAGLIQSLTAAGAPALRASGVAADWDRHVKDHDPSYFPHEYLVPAWRPYYVDEVRSAMAAIGVIPVGSATLAQNFDTLVLTRAARDALQSIPDETLRELARDFFLYQRFRRDVFGRSPRRLNEAGRRARLLKTRFSLRHPPGLVDYSLTTEAGSVDFDNPVARRIVAALSDGPRPLADMLDEGEDAQDLVANALTLCCAHVLWPALPSPVNVERVNAALLGSAGGADDVIYRMLSCGTALRFSRGFLASLEEKAPLSPDAAPWAEFLRRFS